ncbi:MAG: NAD-dependent epimerase/dehydratase family protein [Thermoleophilia bacterium]|nr:NAD-dependent epimerase/dehydratase family protein [Thermoleophilia bacterium]
MGNRVVVTGGAGFIGSHLADALAARGDEVHVVDDLSSGRREQVPDAATLHEQDVSDVDALVALAERIGPVDRWFHLAAQADVRVSVAEPAFDARVNVIGTVAVLAAARLHGAPVTFASTGGAIYGEVTEPADESHAALPPSPYGAAKLAGEVYLGQDARLTGAKHAVVRYANVYGPRQDPHGEAGVVAIFAGLVLEGRPARVFGDGEQTRDYVYVGDVVAATIAASDAAASGSDDDLRSGGLVVPVYNVGTGVATSVNELWATMERAAGTQLGTELHPAREGEIRNSVLDASFATKRLGVAFDMPLVDGLRATIEWIGGRVRA